MARSVPGVATLAAATGRHEQAARLFGTASALRDAIGLALALPERTVYERAIATTRAMIGGTAFDLAWNEGRDLELAEVQAEIETTLSAVLAAPAGGRSDDGHRLSPRERDVLRLLVQGQTDQEIADTLFLSRRTVTTHASHLFAKLGVTNRVEATALALREGLV